jgi:hypothetical protein
MSTEQPEAPPPRINTAAGLSTHPQQLEGFRETLATNDGSTRMAFTSATKALQNVHESIGDMHEANRLMASMLPEHRVLGPDGVMRFVVPESQKAKVADAMGHSFRRGSKFLEDATRIIDEATAQTESRISASLVNNRRNEVAVATTAAQIRDLVRGMKAEERVSFVRKATLEGDLEIVSAVFGSSPFVSGLTRQQLAELRADAEMQFAPNEVRQRDALRAMRQKLGTAGGAYLDSYSRLVPRPNLIAARGEEALAKLRGKVA